MINLRGSFESARFEAELVPHRSITMRGAQIAIGSSALLLGTISAVLGVISQGKALPFVAGFAAILQGGITWGFMCNARDACERQVLKMDETGLTITHTRPDWKSPVVTSIPSPALARIEEKPIRLINKLTLHHHSLEIPLGRFLHPEETEKLKQNLKLALRNWTKDPGPSI